MPRNVRNYNKSKLPLGSYVYKSQQRLEVAGACMGDPDGWVPEINNGWAPEINEEHLICLIKFIAARSSGIRWLEAGKAIAEDDSERLWRMCKNLLLGTREAY